MDSSVQKKETENKEAAEVKKRQRKDSAIEKHIKNMKESYLDSPIYNEETMQRIYDGIVQNLHIQMDKDGLTLRDIEDRCGVSASHLSRIYNGRCRIGLDALIRIASAFDMSIVDFYPVDTNKRLTMGQLIDDAIRPLDINTQNFLLEQIRAFVRHCRTLTDKKN